MTVLHRAQSNVRCAFPGAGVQQAVEAGSGAIDLVSAMPAVSASPTKTESLKLPTLYMNI